MIVRFENKTVLELYQLQVKACVSKYKFAKHIVEKYKLRVGQLIDAPDLKTIGQIKSLNLEKLKGNRKGQFSIRVDNQFRICFRPLNENEIAVEIIEFTDYH
jgi:proteic killer suppression protein